MKNMNTLPRFFRRLLKELPLLVLVALLAGSALSLFQAPVAWAATPIYVRPDGNDTNCDGTTNDPYPGSGTGLACAVQTIQRGISLVDSGGTINVAAGTYIEDVNINKVLTLSGAGIDQSIISGLKTGANSATVRISIAGVIVEGFTITREGNNVTDWTSNVKLAGVAIQTVGNATVRNNKFTGNRTAIDINNSAGNQILNNIIDFNRTGIVLRNACPNNTIEQNDITNNWTIGILWLAASTETATGTTFFNNKIEGNWYTQIENRSLTGGVKNFSGNWLGSANLTTANFIHGHFLLT